MSRPAKSRALEHLRKALDAIPGLKQMQHGSPQFGIWRRNTEVAIEYTFGDEARHVKDFTDISYSLGLYISGMPDSSFQQAYVSGLQSAASVLQSMIEEVEEYWEDDIGSGADPAESESKPRQSDEVFIIHGRDDGTKDTVARFITTLGLKPIILHEQPNQGSTLIEKFERHSQVGFAIALLTPDDVGALQGHENDLQPRARQNVIFEFGYLMGCLGRDHVCAITKGDVEIPSDYAGVVYITMDTSGGWKINLVRELKSAGFEVDANRAL